MTDKIEFILDCTKDNAGQAMYYHGTGPSEGEWEALKTHRWHIVATKVQPCGQLLDVSDIERVYRKGFDEGYEEGCLGNPLKAKGAL